MNRTSQKFPSLHLGQRKKSSRFFPARLKLLLILLLCLLPLISESTTSVKAAGEITFTGTELLGRLEANSASISVVPDSAISLYYEYGTTTGVYTEQTDTTTAAAGIPKVVVIDSLTANTKYYYRMQYSSDGGTTWIPRTEHTFHTQRTVGSTFTFDITSDSHIDIMLGNESNWTSTLNGVASDNPDFLIDLGDTFAMDNGSTSVTLGNIAAAEQKYKDQLPFFNIVSASSGIYVMAGNHEQQEAWHLTASNTGGNPAISLPVMGKNAEKKYFLNPVNDSFYTGDTSTYSYLSGDQLKQDYFAWEWGDALFVVISPFWTTTTKPYTTSAGGGESDTTGSDNRWDWTLGLDQFNWLKSTLEGSSAKYKFVFAHQIVGGNSTTNQVNYGHGGVDSANLVEWGGYNVGGSVWGWDTNRSGWGSQPIRQMMEANGVTAFFHGHDHQYAYEKLNGLVYQAVPSSSFTGTFGIYTTGGNSGNTIWADSTQGPGRLRLTVSPTQTTVDFIRYNASSPAYTYTMLPTGGLSHNLTVEVDPVSTGTTIPEVGIHSYVEGSLVTVTATPAGGYVFDHWSGDCSGTGTCQVTMDADKSVTAHFVVAPSSTITYVGDIGSAISKTSGASLAINTTTAVAAGDDIIIAYATDPNSNVPPFTISDPAGNTYHEIGPAINSGQLRTYLFAAYDVNALPAGSNITITASASVTARAAVVSVFRGLADEDPLDQTSTGTGSSATPSAGPTSTTTEADELLIGAIGTEGPNGDPGGTWLNSFTTGPRTGTTGGTDDTNITISLGYRIVSASGAYTAAKSGITSRDWAALIATFKAEPNPTAPRITIAGTPLSAFSTTPGNPSVEQTYMVSGSNLTDDITISAPSDFQISLSSGSGFGSSLTLLQTDGSVAATPIYVHFYRASEGTSSGNITHTSTGATTRNVAVSGTAAPLSPVTFNIILGRPTDKSVTANIIPDANAEFYVEYGTSSEVYTVQTSTFTATADDPIEIVIGGDLSTNTRYFYHLVYRQTGTTDWNSGAEYSFVTQRSEGEPFTFTVASDSHLGQYGGQTADEYALYAVTMHNIEADHPDFHIDNGDTFAMDPSPLGTGMTEAEAETAYLVERPYMGIIGPSTPIYLAIGNHENEEGWNWDDTFTAPDKSLAIVGLKARKKYYPNPIPDDFYSANTDTLPAQFLAAYPGLPPEELYHEDYFAWTWGDALFVVLDPYHYSMTWPNDDGTGYGGEGQDGEASGNRWDWTLGIEQYLWLKQTLETSDAKYKFVFSHQVTGGETPYGRGGIDAAPYFEWGGKNADGTWGWDTHRPTAEGWDVPIHQLFVDNGVSAYIHGHDHIYAREELDGIVYLEVAKPDDAGYAWDPYGYGYNEDLYLHAIVMLPNSGYIRVAVSPSEANFEYVRSYLPGDGENGVVADSFTILPNATDNHTVTFNANGGTGTMTPQVAGVPTALTLNTFTRTDYSFTGWNTQAGGGGTAYADGTIYDFSADIILYAQWTALPTHTVTFDANGGSGTMSPQTASSPTALTLNTFTRTAYSFSGWNTAADGSGTPYADGATYDFSADIILYAQWSGILGDVNHDDAVNSTDALIVLSYDAGLDTSAFYPMNCGDVNNDTYINSTDALIILSYDAGMTVPFPVGQPGCPLPSSTMLKSAPIPAQSHSAISPVVTSDVEPDSGKAQIPALSGSAISSATPSNATPSIGQQIDVEINIDISGVNPPDNTLGSFSASLDWDTTVLAYHSNSGILAGFTGVVNTANVTSGHIVFNGANLSGATGNVLVLRITFDVVGTGISSLDLGYSAMAAASTFTNLLPVLTVNDGQVMVSSPNHTVTFDSNGGSGSMAPQVSNVPANLTLNTFTRTGYSFSGWNTQAGGGGAAYGDGATYDFSADITLYAQWSALPMHTVTFNANAGTGTMAPQVANIPTPLTLNTFTRTGYSFDGWNTASDGSGTPYADGATYDFSADITLYAQWKIITVPPLPSSFYGEIHIFDNSPETGDVVEAYVPGVTGPVVSTTIVLDSSTLIYTINIPGDDGIGPKEGGMEGDEITFKINGRIVATAIWHSGTNVRLDIHPPEALPGDTYSGDEGSPISFDGAANDWGSDAATYQWDWDNDGIYDATGQDPTYTWLDDGTKTVGLKVIDAQGGEGTTTFEVTVIDVLPSNVSAGGPYEGPAGQAIALSGSATCAVVDTCTFAWDLDNDGDYDDAIGASTSHTWNAIGDYLIGLKVTDDDGNEVTDTADVHITVAVHSIDLVSGWNLISFYVHPQDTDIEVVLASIDGHYDLVYAWDATKASDNWLKYDPGVPYGNSLATLDETMGFWIHMTVADTLEVTGNVPETTDIELSDNAGGWNLVGYPASVNGALPEILSDQLGTDFSLVYAYHANDSGDPWKLFDRTGEPYANDLDELSPGWGYWIMVSADHTWTVEFLPE